MHGEKMLKYKQTNEAINKKCELRRAAEQLIYRASLRVAARAQKNTAAQFQRLFFQKNHKRMWQSCEAQLKT